MRRVLNRRTLLALAVLAALAFIVPPYINLSRYKSSVASAIERALGRQVTVGGISLQLLPQPGLTLYNFAVSDDPAMSAEPVLRADEVTASLRLSSLWRGRLEIAKLKLKYPSLNLVRSPDAHWNLESLVERARQIPSAPTAKTSPEARPRFPYIEADTGRINLKFGPEKLVWALTEADFALWLESENEWHMRLEARPMRTDSNLTDTGTLKVSGVVRRAASLGETPLVIQLTWQDAQLGQITHFLYGRDRGWRGGIRASALLQGTPRDLKLRVDAASDDFRRYDIVSAGNVRLGTHCTAHYTTLTWELSEIHCQSAVGGGTVEVEGELLDPLRWRRYRAAIEAANVPVASLANLARHMKKDLPDDLNASGMVQASFAVTKEEDQAPVWSGHGSTTQVQLVSSLLEAPVNIGTVNFSLGQPTVAKPPKRAAKPTPTNGPSEGTVVLTVDQFSLPLGNGAPAIAQAWVSRTAYSARLDGDAQISPLLSLAHAIGIPAPQLNATGAARVSLEVAGNWSGFQQPLITGTAVIRNATAQLNGFASALQIAGASVELTRDGVSVQQLAALFPAERISFGGNVQFPRMCKKDAGCTVSFQLHSDELDTDEINRLLNPNLRKREWFGLVASSKPADPFLLHMNAKGTITTTRLLIHSALTTHVTADAELRDRVLSLRNVSAEILGGKHVGEWTADFSGQQPQYSGGGTIDGVSLDQLAALTGDHWATGKAKGNFRGSASGWNAAEILASAQGSLSFDWRDGTLSHFALGGNPPPLRIRRFAGTLALKDGVLTIDPGRLEGAAGIYEVNGTASLARKLELQLKGEGARSFTVDGTLEKPHIVAVGATAEVSANSKREPGVQSGTRRATQSADTKHKSALKER